MSETLLKYGAKYNTTVCSFCGLSTDAKPTGLYEGIYIASGSDFIEMDTNKKYLFNQVILTDLEQRYIAKRWLSFFNKLAQSFIWLRL